MAFEGMNPDQVEQYGHQLVAESSNIENLIHSITSQVSTLAANWQGQDSEQFQREWSGTYIRQMQSAHDALYHLGQAALRNAHDQRQTSAAL
jgi:WXG100 family type VII secretion target